MTFDMYSLDVEVDLKVCFQGWKKQQNQLFLCLNEVKTLHQVQDEGITNKLTGWILVQDEIFRVVKITF